MGKQLNLQDSLLNFLRKNKVSVIFNLIGGEKLEGVVKGFDNFVVVMKDVDQKMIYKHAISYLTTTQEIDDIIIG